MSSRMVKVFLSCNYSTLNEINWIYRYCQSATYILYTAKRSMFVFFCCTLKLHIHPRHLCLFSGNYREDGRAWEAGMKRNNGVVYISIGPKLVLPNRQITFYIFHNSLYLLCIIFASLNLYQTVNRCMSFLRFLRLLRVFELHVRILVWWQSERSTAWRKDMCLYADLMCFWPILLIGLKFSLINGLDRPVRAEGPLGFCVLIVVGRADRCNRISFSFIACFLMRLYLCLQQKLSNL